MKKITTDVNAIFLCMNEKEITLIGDAVRYYKNSGDINHKDKLILDGMLFSIEINEYSHGKDKET